MKYKLQTTELTIRLKNIQCKFFVETIKSNVYSRKQCSELPIVKMSLRAAFMRVLWCNK